MKLTHSFALKRHSRFAKSLATSLGLSIVALSSLVVPSAKAGTRTWTGATNATWETTSNWSTALPGSADIALWDTSSTANLSITLGSPESVLGLTVINPSGAVTLSGSTLTLGTSGIDMSAATQNLTINSALVLGPGNQTWNVATGRTLTTSAFTRVGAGATLLIDKSTNTGTVTASPALTNSVVPWAIVKSSGSAANNSANGYTFATVSAGNVVAYTGATALTSGYPANAATVNYDWSSGGTQAVIGSSRAANTIRYTGTGVTQATNSTQTETFNALMNAGSGTVTLGGGSTMNIQSPNGELVLAAMTGNIVINGPVINNGATAGAVTILGSGSQTVSLAGANTFSGGLNVNSGTLLLSNTGAAGTGTLNINSGGTATFAVATGTFATTVAGSGAIVNNTANTIIFTGNQTGFTGTFTHNAGSNNTQFNSANSASQNAAYNLTAGELIFALAGDYTVKMGSLASTAGNIRGGNSATGTTTLEVGNLGTNTSIAGNLNNGTTKVLALTKVGSGTLTLLGANNYSGATTISGGTLQIGDGATDGTITNTVSITNNGALVYNRVGSSTYAGPISGTGLLTKLGAGSQTLSGSNNYSGATNVNAGILTFSGTAATGAINVADTATLGVKVTNTGTNVVASTGLTFGTSGTSNFAVDFNSLANPTASVIALSSGTLTRNGTINVSLANTTGLSTATNTLALLSYGTRAGSGAYNLLTTSVGHTTFALNDTASALYLNVTAATNTWTGAIDGTWDIGTAGGATGAKNWSLSDQVYLEGDKVVFDDSATVVTDVQLSSSNVNPGSVVVSNTNKNYSFGGSFGIAGSTTLNKNGTGALTISNSNSYIGATTLNSGTLILNNPSALGTSAVTINGGTLDSGSATVMTANNTQNWNGDFAFAGTTDLDMGIGAVTVGGSGDRTVTVTSGALSVGELKTSGSTQGFIKQGSGTLVLGSDGAGAAASVINGLLTVATGTLQINRSSGNSGDLTVGGLTGSGTITNGAAVERWLFINTTGTNTFSGTLADGNTGLLGVNKQGTGTQTLGGGNNFTGRLTVGGGTLILGGSASLTTLLDISGGTLDLGANLGLGNATTLISGTGGTINATGGGRILINSAGGDLGVANGGTLTINAVIADGTQNAIDFWNTASGTGVVVLTASNTWSGTTNVQTGIVSVSNIGNTGVAGNLGVNGTIHIGSASSTATLRYTGGGETTDRVIDLSGTTGGATIEQNGSGLLKFTSSLTASGTGNKTLTLQGSGNGELAGSVVNPSTGAVALTKSVSGTWTLSGSNSYTGQTTLGAGTLVSANLGALGDTSRVLLSDSTTLIVRTDGGDNTIRIGMGSGSTINLVSDRATAGAGVSHPLSVLNGSGLGGGMINITSGSNVTSGAGSFTFDTLGLGSGSTQTTTLNPTTATVSIGDVTKFNNANLQTLGLDGTSTGNQVSGSISNGSSTMVSLTKSNTSTWSLSGASTYTGTTSIIGGTLNLAGSLGNTAVNVSGGTLSLQNAGAINQNILTVSGSGSLVETVNNAISGTAALVVTNTTTTLANANSYSGGTTIGSAGGAAVIRASATGALGTGTIGFDVTGNGSTARLELAGNTTLNNTIALAGRNNTTVGIESISGNNTLAGTVAVFGGGNTWTIQSDSGSDLALTGATAITSIATGTRGITLQGDSTGSVGGAITTGSATTFSVTKSGTGTWMLSGVNSYNGATTVNAGILAFGVGETLAGGLNIGTSGTAALTAHTGGAGNVKAIDTSALTLNGSGVLDLNNNALVVRNGSLAAITAAIVSGANGGVWNGPGLVSSTAGADTNHITTLGASTAAAQGLTGGSFAGVAGLSGSDVLVKYTYYGDANFSGTVTGADYGAIDTGFGAHLTGWENGDFNLDGAVTGADYGAIDTAFGLQGGVVLAQGGGVGSQAAAVPEPGTVGLMIVGALGGAILQRRNSKRNQG